MEIISGHQRITASVEPDGVDGVRDYLSGLRQSINSHLLNVGVLSAFMSALAASVYVGMPQSPQCLGMTTTRRRRLGSSFAWSACWLQQPSQCLQVA